MKRRITWIPLISLMLPFCLIASRGLSDLYALFLCVLFCLLSMAILWLLERRVEHDPLPEMAPKVVEKPRQFDGSNILYRCLELASNVSSQLGRYGELGGSAIDLRRLEERLRGERSAVIALYSRSAQRLLFVNSFVRSLFGYSADTFCKEFPGLIDGGRTEWEDAVASLREGEERMVRIVVRSRSGEGVLVRGLLSPVPKGPFRGLVMVTLFR
jgi:PAS domain-containing protein